MILKNIHNIRDLKIETYSKTEEVILKRCSNWKNVQVVCSGGRMEECYNMDNIFIGNKEAFDE